MKKLWLFCGIALLGFENIAQAKVAFNIEYLDASGYGFNSTTATTAIGGNTGTTLGAQRRNAFEAALKKYENVLTSSVAIHVQAYFENMGGTSYSATLASAGPERFSYNFRNAPRSNIAFPTALANKLSSQDLSNSSQGIADIEVSINNDVDGSALGSSSFYYGLDGNGPSYNIDFITVITHEVMHGLGFLTLVDPENGSAHSCSSCTGLIGDIYATQLARGTNPNTDFTKMSQSDRLAAATAEGQIVWTGSDTLSQAGNLTGGKLNGYPLMYTPNPAELGSSLSHNDFDVDPETLMQPGYTGPLGLSAINLAMLADIGWGSAGDLEASLSLSDSETNTMTLVLSNNGNSNVSNGSLVLTTNSGSFTSLDNSNCILGTLKITCTISSLTAGQTTNYDYQLINGSGTATVTANLGGSLVDLVPDNNEDTITFETTSNSSSTSTSDRSLDGSSDSNSSGTTTVIKESGGSNSYYIPLLLCGLLIGRLKNLRK